MAPTTNDPFKRHRTTFIVTFIGVTIMGFTLIVLAAHSIDVAADVEKALSGWRLRLTSSIVLVVGFVCFAAGFICSLAILFGWTRVFYVVGFVQIPLLVALIAIGASSLLGAKKVKNEAFDRTREAFDRMNDSIETRDTLFRLQIDQKCCGVEGPSFYSFFVNPNLNSTNGTNYFVPSSCCFGGDIGPGDGRMALPPPNNTNIPIPPDSAIATTNASERKMEEEGEVSWTLNSISSCSPEFAFNAGCADKVRSSMKTAYLCMGGLTVLCAFFLFIIIVVDWLLIGRCPSKLYSAFDGPPPKSSPAAPQARPDDNAL